MDLKTIEMNNLRVLNDYLNQTIDVLVRSPRLANGHTPSFGYSPFAGSIPGAPSPIGTDVVWGATPYGFSGGQQMFGGVSPFTTPSVPFTGLPLMGMGMGPGYGTPGYGTPGYGTVDPFLAQRASFGSWQQPWQQQPWQQQPWAPISEVTRQAQVAHALAAKQSVLEAMYRLAGIPV
jgi:hypothetical protein